MISESLLATAFWRRFGRRLYFFAYITGIGLLSNVLAAQLPGGFPFLLGNMAYAVIVLRLGLWWGLVCSLMVTAVIAQPGLRLLAFAELLLIALFVRHLRWHSGKALLVIWLLLLPAVLWLTRPADNDVLRWLLGSTAVVTTGIVTLIGGARIVESITRSAKSAANEPFARPPSSPPSSSPNNSSNNGSESHIPALQGRVLIAEGVAGIRQLISHLLEQTGAVITAVENGEQAVSIALAEAFDLILIDMHMPMLDGCEAIGLLRAAGCETPIVALTADALSEDVAKLYAIGANRVLAKPIDQDKLWATVSEYLPAGPAHDRPTPDVAVQHLLKELQQRYCRRLPEQIEQLQAAMSAPDKATLLSELHKIKGSAGTFGYPELSTLAQIVEAEFQSTTAALTRAQCANVLAPLLAEMKHLAEQPAPTSTTES